MSIKKLNVIFGAVVAAFGVTAAEAGSLVSATAGGRIYAVEAFGPTSTNTTGITPAALTYTLSTTSGLYVGAGGTLNFYYRLSNGATFASAPAANTFSGTLVNVGSAGNGVVGTPILSTDSSTILVPVTFTNAATIGVGTNIVYAPAALIVSGVKTTLGVAGGSVSMTASLSAVPAAVVAPSATTAPNSVTAQPTDIEASGTAVIAKSAAAVTATVSALPGYTGRIDLTASPAASNYSLSATPGTAVVAKLGSATFTNATTAANQYDGTTPATVATAAAGGATPVQITVTPGTGQSFPIGSVISLSTTADQCVTRVGALAAFTSTTASAAAVLTLPNANTTSGTAIEVCLTAPSTGNTASAITPTISAALAHLQVAATYGSSSASGTGFALALNGSTVDVQTYWPGALTAYNFNGYLRVTNTGTLSAAVTGQNYTTLGVLNTAQPAATIVTLAPGESKILSTKAIDAIIGANPSGIDAGRVRIAAPTNGLRVVSMLQAASGNLTEYPNVNNCTTSGTVAAVTGGGGTVAAVAGGVATLTANTGLSALAANAATSTFGNPTLTAITMPSSAASTIATVSGGGGTVSTTCNTNSL
jgi:hypothetical protein